MRRLDQHTELDVKLLRHGSKGAERPGVIDADGTIRDLGGVVPDIGPESLANGVIERIRAVDPKTLPVVPATSRRGACLSRVGNFIAVGLNYADHAAESVGSSRVDLQACKLEYSIVSPK